MIILQGVDIADVRRMEKTIRRSGKRFIQRIFTAAEIAYCESKRMKYEHYAARFAAKEAAMKALEVRRESRTRFREIEIKRAPTGKPFLYLSPISRKRFRVPEKCQIEISMAHEREFAIATVLVVIGKNKKEEGIRGKKTQ